MNNELSPCIGVCVVKDDLCIGCNRTLLEIAEWSNYNPEEKQIILEQINLR
jgi:uncharacterized protein